MRSIAWAGDVVSARCISQENQNITSINGAFRWEMNGAPPPIARSGSEREQDDDLSFDLP